MSYQVLARKWRPKNFLEVVGQEHVLRALSNALEQQRLHHAYLFSGTRGVGKTTIARILAKCFNCESGITSKPCGKCDTCIEIDSGKLLDLIEVDAASRTKVEDTRDLLDNVQYLPTKSRYKIYIIDEVHMLSGHSFNALLKTLEEPPEHVKFLLATTDPQKLPITVLSRCLQFNLRAINPDMLQKQLQHILNQEKIAYEDQALHQLAISANGSVRDALSLLDQAIAFGLDKVVTEDVKNMIGASDIKKVFTLLEGLISNDANLMLKTISELTELSTDFINTVNEILEILHQISTIQLAPDTNTSNWQYPELVVQLSKQITPEEAQLYYQIALIGKRDLSLAPSLKSGFEMIMLRMLAFRPSTCTPSKETIQKKTPDIKKKTVGITKPLDKEKPSVKKGDSTILQKLKLTGPTKALLQHCVISKNTGNEIELMLEPNQSPLLNKTHEKRISTAFSEYYNSQIKVTIKLGTNNMETQANIKKLQDTKKQDEALQFIEKDHKMQRLINKFDAKLIANDIKD